MFLWKLWKKFSPSEKWLRESLPALPVREFSHVCIISNKKAETALAEAGSNVIVQFQSYGGFNRTGIRILQRFHRLRKLRNEVKFEEEWLRYAFQNMDNTLKSR